MNYKKEKIIEAIDALNKKCSAIAELNKYNTLPLDIMFDALETVVPPFNILRMEIDEENFYKNTFGENHEVIKSLVGCIAGINDILYSLKSKMDDEPLK